MLWLILAITATAFHFHIEDEWLSHPAPLSLSDPPRPQIPPAFTSSIQMLQFSFWSPGLMYYDLVNRRSNITVQQPAVLNFTTIFRELALNDSYYININDRCQPVDNATFGDFFSWVKVGNYMGNKNLGPAFQNRTCDLWQYTTPQYNLSLCAQGDMPVMLDILQADATMSFSIYFEKDFFPNTPPASLFVPTHNCLVPDPLCPGGEIQEIDAFIFHPAGVFDLNNENVADLLGDVVFICYDVMDNHTAVDQYQWVSRYTLQVWSAWGQYAECNRPSPNATGNCIGSEKFSVGRETPWAMKEKCGQCTNNSDTGNWYSLPTAGMCNSSTQPLGSNATLGDCTWRVVERIKTIDGKCMIKQNDMLGSCLKEQTYPFTQSAAIMLQSFESSDPAQGGCPAIA